MKRIIISLMLTCIATISFATDFYVAESFDNTNNRFNTISAAIAAASTGDKIYIQDKPVSGYEEDIIIAKSISLINMNNNERFTVTGKIYSYNPSVSLKILGMELNGNILTVSKNVFVSNCLINGYIDADYLTCVNSDIRTITSTNAKNFVLFGNKINQFAYQNHIPDENSQDTLILIGNRIGGEIFTSKTLFLNNNNVYASIKNNEIIVQYVNLNSGQYEFINNTIRTGYSININSQQSSTSLSFKFYNNILVSANKLFIESANELHAITKREFKYNVTTNSVFYTDSLGKNINFDETNLTNATIAQVDENSIFTGDNVNAGDPDPLMSDLDLTRNDAGCHGGPNSISNYFPQNDAGARVYKIEMPRRFFTGSNVNIKAYGVDK